MDKDKLILQQPLYMMQAVGESKNTDLLVRDLVESTTKSGLQLHHPICFDCFDKILGHLDEKIKDQESEKKLYAESLALLESEIRKQASRGDSDLQ